MNRTSTMRLATIALLTSTSLACADPVEGTHPSRDAPDSELGLRLEPREPGSGRLVYTLTNHGAAPVHVLRWKLPTHENPDALFRVFRAGSEVAYRGPVVHRPRPQRSHYVELAPGESLSAELDLSQSFDMSETGRYHVRSAPLPPEFVLESDAVEPPAQASLELDFDARRAATGGPEIGVKSEALAFMECDEMQAFILAFAQQFALGYADEAASHYITYGHDERGELWFGSQGASGQTWIRNTLDAIEAHLEANNLTYLCNDTFGRGCADAVAVMYPWLPNLIQICSSFFDQPFTGAYSMGATIVHEVAHFHWTYDIAFGVSQCIALAATNPGAAAVNAESFALYSVNPPPDTP